MIKPNSDHDVPTTSVIPEKSDLCLGIMALSDCAVMAVAKEKGFFEQNHLNVRLSKEASWANIRDKVFVGELDGAQMLAAMPIAATIGIEPLRIPMSAAFSLGLNGNAITVSDELLRLMIRVEPDIVKSPSALIGAAALKKAVEGIDRKLVFAHVYPYSSHNYELRFWLASAGIDPDEDVQLVVIPPAQMVNHLRDGDIDGYCVGEPWNGLAAQSGIGHTLVSSYDLWNNKPEKVFAVTQDWLSRYPATHLALLISLLQAAQWTDQPANRQELAEILCTKGYVDAPVDVISRSLHGNLEALCRHPGQSLPDFNVFFRYAASYPWVSHAEWLISQMYRWGQIEKVLDIRKTAMDIYRPDLYRRAAQRVGIACPAEDGKIEGCHSGKWMLNDIEMGSDLFFDGSIFNPADVVDYIARFDVNKLRVDINALARQYNHGGAQ